MNNPTIVSAALSDKELQDSINRMVANFDKGLQTMLEHSNEYVGKIQESLQKIGNTNFGAKGSNDGGVAKQTKAQEEFTESVKRSTNEIKRQGKETAMSFDQIAAALSRARQTVSDFNTKRASGILPSSEDYKRYEQALARIVEYNDKLKQSALAMADANQKAFSFDGRRLLKDAFSTDDRLKQLNKYYAEQEKLSQKAIQDEERQRQKRVAAMEKESAAQKKMIDDQYRLSFARTMKIPTDQLDLAQAKLERLQALLRDMRERGILSNTQIASTEAEIRKLEQIIGQVNTAQQQTTQSAQRYTEEIRKQAQVIRESKQWKETGTYSYQIGDATYYVSKKQGEIEAQLVRHKEQQVNYEKEYLTAGMAVEQNTKQQAATEEKLIQAEQQRLGIEQEIAKARREYISPTTTTYTAPTTDMLRKFIASKAGVDVKDVKIFDETTASASKLQGALKQLQTAYSNMTAEERNSPFGQALMRRFQELQRESQKTQRQLSRPVSLKDALGGSEKTLDDIAYKMQRLRSYKQGIDLTKPNATNEIKQVDNALAKLQKDADKWMSKSNEMIKSNTALGRSWNYMKNRLAFYFTVGASTSFVKNLIEIRGQYELLDRSIGILIDSAQNGSQIFAELNAMAIKSPFTTMELGAAAKQLVAYDVAAKDVVDTTRRLADMAAAVGIPIERLTYALGQIKAYGYLNARDARMFANAGIPLVKELADYYTELEGRLVSTADVYDRIKKKAIDYSDVMSVVNKMTDEGGKFFDFQEKAADTLKVRIANLTLAWNNMLNEMGKDNQGILTEGLKVTKQIFESWRDINNMVIALGLTYGTIKAAQIAYYLWVMRTEKAVGAWSKIINAIDYAFNAKIANAINSLKTSLVGFFTNPAAMLAVAFTALSVALTKAYLDYRDLQAANEEFNKSIVKNAEENVKSIDKFFGDYKKQLESVGSLNSADQTKLWERVQEEIEKTTKNAEKYIEILNKIPEVSKRIEVGESVLEQSKRIQDELKYMAERGMFNVGGGFANDSAAKDLQQYSDAVNELITKYGDLDKAKKEALKVNEITLESGETIRQYTGEYADFQRAQIEAEKELQNIVSTLDKVNMAEILGTGDMETQLANIRSFAIAWRDAFLATEKGSKISAEGQALLNSYIDKWIEQQARVNHLIKDENTAAVEANRTAWETFFKFLNTEERKRLDVAIKTNQLGSKSVQELWDNAAERMQEKATTSYNLIQQQIADLRNTPDIVINVVYRNNKEKLEKDQEEFEKKFIQPKNWGALSTDEYIKQEKANREKYGTLMRKQGEDTAEYEKRISDERKKNLELSEKNGKVIEENKNKTSEYSIAVTKLADKEKKAADDRLKVIKDVEDAGGYDFSTKSERAAANKAAKQAESELAKALKDEFSTIEKVRSIYKDLTKEGMSHANAVERATRGWDETANAINRVLQKNGLQKLDLSKFAGIENPRELVNMLQSQLNTLLKRGAKPTEIKELQTKVNTLEVDADKYDLTKITKGLNNELGKLKDEYELAVELDANPELGGIFADMMGLNKEQLSQMPKDFDSVVERLQKIIDNKLGAGKFNLIKNLNKASFDAWLEANKQGKPEDDALAKSLESIIDYANKVRLDSSKKQIEEWNKLLEKYAEYEYKVTQIQKEAEREREIARKKGASQEILDAINNKEKQELARVSFEEFQKSPEWIVATGDLANMSKSAIGLLIDQLEKYKRSAKNLSPKQIKQLNSALGKLYKEQRKSNPFKAISNMLDEAKERMATFDEDIEKTQKEIDNLTKKKKKNIVDGIVDDETDNKLEKAIKRLKELKKARKETGKVDASSWVSSINETIGAVQSAIGVFDDLAKAIGGVNNSDLDKAFSVIDKAGQGAAIGAQIGGGWGALIGGVAGAATGLISIFAGAENERITDKIEESERAVKRLELAYIDLDHAVQQAYGMATIGANMAAKANKELQLVELKRQLALERSRDSKHRDEDKIIDLQKQIKELEYDIADTVDNIVNDLLGMSSVGDAMENMMDAFIEALRSGEDAMATFDENVDEMIANMVKKMFTTKILQPWFEEQWNKIQEQINQRAGDIPDKLAEIQSKTSIAKNADITNNDSLVEALRALGMPDDQIDRLNWYNEFGQYDWGLGSNARLKAAYEKMLKEAEQKEIEIQKELTTATMPTTDDIRQYAELLRSGQPIMEENMQEVANFLRELGLMKDTASDKSLSALQQGIQGITEDTAGALEAITNGISQQCYLQSDILTQIRDAVVGMDIDIQMATQAQILLQLQSSYQVQMSIQGILEGVLNPSGRAFSVELIS